MAADQTARMSSKDITVVPTCSVQAGLAAAVAYVRRNDGASNVRDMNSAINTIVTADITWAVRDSLVDGVEVKEGDCLGLIDGQVVFSAPQMQPVIEGVVSRLLEGEREMLTVLVGEDSESADALAIVQDLCVSYPSVEVDICEGGQPLYPLLFSAE